MIHMKTTIEIRQGSVLPLTDLAIAVCALRAEALLITTDPHFEAIPGLVCQSHLPE